MIARQARFRPVTQDGLPLIGSVPQLDRAYVATGHNFWGILNALATGKVLAELIEAGIARTTGLAGPAPASTTCAAVLRLTTVRTLSLPEWYLGLVLFGALLFSFFESKPTRFAIEQFRASTGRLATPAGLSGSMLYSSRTIDTDQ